VLIGKILVLSRRDLKKWSKSRFSLAWVVLRPLPWLLLFGKSLDPSKFLGDVSGSTQQQTEASLRGTLSGAPDYFSFMAIGMLSVMVMTLSMLSMGSIVFDRYTGFLDKVLASPARRETILLSKVVASTTRGIIQAIALFLVALALGMQTGSGFGIFEAIEAFAVLVILGFGMSSIFVSIGARIKRWEAQEAVATAITFPIMFTSNALYPLEHMPSWLRPLAILNPITHSTSILRQLIYGSQSGPFSTVYPDILFLGAFTLLSGIVLFVVANRIRRINE